MKRRCASAFLVGLVLTAASIGCGSPRLFSRLRPESKEAPRLLPESLLKRDHARDKEKSKSDAPILRTGAETVALDPTLPPRPPKNILALSGGGSYGAFTAGILNGWSRSNNRPEFDVVTGVSTGALIAPLAFLGPKYDFELKKFYTEIRKRDVFANRAWATIPFRDAVATTAPLRRIVTSGITEEMVEEIAEEHKKGRRLYVATTHLEARKSVVWDLGAIACKYETAEARKMICDVLMASAAVPGIFPPVPISVEVDGKKRTEMHVDGGVTAALFVPPSVLEEAGKGEKPGTLYVIVAGKLYTEPAKVRPRLLRIITASGAALMRSHTRMDVSNMYHMAKLNKVDFRFLALRQDYPGEEKEIEFDQALMTKLFVEGVKLGVDGPVWHIAPPERGPGESEEIRTGRKLLSKP